MRSRRPIALTPALSEFSAKCLAYLLNEGVDLTDPAQAANFEAGFRVGDEAIAAEQDFLARVCGDGAASPPPGKARPPRKRSRRRPAADS